MHGRLYSSVTRLGLVGVGTEPREPVLKERSLEMTCLQDTSDVIYHIVPKTEFRAQIQASHYIPVRFAEDGFIHCTHGQDLLLRVANDYFSQVAEPVLVIAIDVNQLTSEMFVEPPAPVAGGGQEHLRDGVLFPHIYGPLNLDAVIGVGQLELVESIFQWPREMHRLNLF